LDPSYDKPKTDARQLALRVTVGRDEGKVFPLVEGFIGKKASCDIRLTDQSLSALHARIAMRREAWMITDLTSAPDIRVNNTVV
jgi:predicted component of type VI protein secretion system